MTSPDERELERLAAEGAMEMAADQETAVSKLVAAYEIAIALGDAKRAAALGLLAARCHSRRGRYASSLRFVRKAIASAPTLPAAFSTRASICEYAAKRSYAAGKHRRALSLYRAAGQAYTRGAMMCADPQSRAKLLSFAEQIAQLIDRLAAQ